jgi:hypothetical protein
VLIAFLRNIKAIPQAVLNDVNHGGVLGSPGYDTAVLDSLRELTNGMPAGWEKVQIPAWWQTSGCGGSAGGGLFGGASG